MRQAISLLSGRLAGAVSQALLLVVLARASPLEVFGAYGTSAAIGAIALGVTALGIPTRVMRIDPDDAEGVGRSAVIWSLPLSAAAAAVALAASAGYLRMDALACAAGAAFIFAEGVVNVCQNYAFGLQRLRTANWIMALRRIIPLASTALPAALSVTGASGSSASAVYVALILGTLFSVPVALALIWGVLASRRHGLLNLVRESRQYWLTNVWSMLQQLDVVIVGNFAGSASAGVFSAAFRLASPVHIVTGLLVARLIPVVSTQAKLNPERVTQLGAGKYLRLGGIYAAVLALGSAPMSLVAMYILGPSFQTAGVVISILFLNSAISVLNQLLSALIFAIGVRVRAVTIGTAISTVVGLSIVAAGAIHQNLNVAAAGTCAIQALLLVWLGATTYLIRRRKHNST